MEDLPKVVISYEICGMSLWQVSTTRKFHESQVFQQLHEARYLHLPYQKGPHIYIYMQHFVLTCSIILPSIIKLFQMATELQARNELKLWISGKARYQILLYI